MSDFDQIKYQNNYIKEKYDRIGLTIPKGEKERIKEVASKRNMSINEFIYSIIKKELESWTLILRKDLRRGAKKAITFLRSKQYSGTCIMMNVPVLRRSSTSIEEICLQFVCATSASDIYSRHRIASEWTGAMPENGGITYLVASYKARWI